MAENKRSFLLYTDVYFTIQKLTDDQAGKLFKHILSYVNDENPTTNDVIIELVFEPIKQALKRDLLKYKEIIENRSGAGRLGGIRSGEVRRSKKEANEASALKRKQTKQRQANEAVSVIDNVNVIDNVSDKEKNLIPPPIFLIARYCKERNNGIDADYFYDWYQTRGWKVGKDQMKDWQSAIRTWEKRNNNSKPKLMMP